MWASVSFLSQKIAVKMSGDVCCLWEKGVRGAKGGDSSVKLRPQKLRTEQT